MAWCPKCRNEYVDGITKCNDCNIDLVEELEEINNLKYLNINGYPNPDELADYLHKASIKSAKFVHLDEEDIDAIAVDEKEYFDARLHMNVFLQNSVIAQPEESTDDVEDNAEATDESEVSQSNDTENTDTPSEASEPIATSGDDHSSSSTEETTSSSANDIVDKDDTKDNTSLTNVAPIQTSGKGSYTRYKDKYEDVNSSAYTLLVVGSIGFIALICEIAGLYSIPVASHSKVLFYLVMGGVFIAFIISGFISMMRATELKLEAEKEDLLIQDILNWFKENYSAESIDASVDVDTQEELLYFNRAEFIKDSIMHQFETVDENLVDSLIENIYSDLYEND